MEQPAVTPFVTQDGSHSLLSTIYDVPYHSKYGAIQESRHVFIEAGLHPLLLRDRPLRILEVGFGTGLNTLLSLQASRKRSLPVFYQAIERDPIPFELARSLNFPSETGYPEDLELFHQIHQTAGWNQVLELPNQFQLLRQHQSFENAALEGPFDLIYYDAFAPNAQPELWETSILSLAVEQLLPEGVFVTYCAKGAVKRSLRELGCTVEALPGPPGKREMTRAVKIG